MEYSKYRSQHIENGGREFNLDACRKAAEKYNIIQQSCVRRSQVKKEIMAGCYYQSCLELGFSPAKSDIAAFMQLQTKGISKGTNFLRSFVADKKIELMEVDPYTPVINSVFASYYGTENGNSDLKKAVYEIVQLCLANGIGTASILRSKIAAATFVVTQRSDKQSPPIGIAEFCVMVGIRRNTVEKFLEEMDNFHSYFEEIYIKFKLDATEPKPREVGKARRASKVVKK
jgi:phosphoglycolate phosphatase-like HAD superfamily hydrolase